MTVQDGAGGSQRDAADPQRNMLYSAEDEVEPTCRRFSRWVELETFVDEVVAGEFWTAELPRRWRRPTAHRVYVVRRSSSATASLAERDRPVIHIRSGHWSSLVVLHELAHLVVHDGDPHGPVFAGVELDLIRWHVSFDMATALSESFARHGVDVATPSTTVG